MPDERRRGDQAWSGWMMVTERRCRWTTARRSTLGYYPHRCWPIPGQKHAAARPNHRAPHTLVYGLVACKPCAELASSPWCPHGDGRSLARSPLSTAGSSGSDVVSARPCPTARLDDLRICRNHATLGMGAAGWWLQPMCVTLGRAPYPT